MSTNELGRWLGWTMIGLPLVLCWAVAVSAHSDFSRLEIRTTSLGSGLAMLEGPGGNLGVSTGPDGVFLIDDPFAPLTEKIRAAIAKLSPESIRFVLNTHWHGDHAGGNENLGRGGVLILAHHHVRARMSSPQFTALRGITTPASPPEALPVVTFEDGVSLHLNGHTIEVQHVGPPVIAACSTTSSPRIPVRAESARSVPVPGFWPPPGRFVETVRVEAARRQLEESKASLEQIAERVGLGTGETLRRAFLRQLGVGLSAYRDRFSPPRNAAGA